VTLKICHVTTFYPPHNFGGDGIEVQRLCRALAQHGHEVTVAYDPGAYETLSSGVAPEEPAADGVEVVRLRNRFGRLALLLGHQLGRPVAHGASLAELYRERRFDVINFHNISLVGGPGLLRLGDALKLYMAHEHWLVCPTHVLWRHNREPCTGRQCLRCVAAFRRPPQLWRYTGALQRAARSVDAFIALSEFSRAKHREFGFDADFELLPCFLPEEPRPAAATPAEPPHPRPYFLFVGRLTRMKGLHDVIPVFARGPADLLIAGDGEQRTELERIAGGSAHIRFLGRVAQADLTRYYRHAIALVAPSIGVETFGIVLIEAFRERLPVIARRLGPSPEIVARSGGGELFSSQQELAAAAARLHTDTAYRDTLAENGYRAYRQHWTAAAVVPQYIEIIRRTALKRGRRDVAERAMT
jgi:glycosyltransferase involved in cell wall biosynthesis